jgi:WD40 repeat protein
LNGRVRKWDLAAGKLIAVVNPGVATDDDALAEVKSPDGKRKLRLVQLDFTAAITGPESSGTGQIQHQGAVVAGAFSPDSTCFLTGAQDNTARLWHSATLKPIGPVITHQRGARRSGFNEGVWPVAFSPDGKAFWTGSDDGARLRVMPPIVKGEAERIVLWVQVLTGAKLKGVQFHGLNAEEMLSSQERLEKMGGAPLP